MLLNQHPCICIWCGLVVRTDGSRPADLGSNPQPVCNICNMYFAWCYKLGSLWIVAKSHLCKNMRICTLPSLPCLIHRLLIWRWDLHYHRHPTILRPSGGWVQRGRQRTHKNVPRPCSINYKIGFRVEATPPRLPFRKRQPFARRDSASDQQRHARPGRGRSGKMRIA